MNKSALRAVFLEKRRELSPLEIFEKSRHIADRFFAEFNVNQMRTMHCFISIPRLGEIDTSLIYESLWTEFPHIRTAAPRMNRISGEIESLQFSPGSELIKNHWGIREPVGEHLIDPGEIDTVLVPVLCYDINGNRVGYGKGFYDRFLVKCRPDCRKVGLSFFAPVDRIGDVNKHDVRLDECLTPETRFVF